MRHRLRGLTLIELMTVLVIVSILASLAIPSYRAYVQRSNRAAAKTVLLENAQFMERNFTASNRYDKDGAGNNITTASLPILTAPKGADPKYDITLDPAPTATTFTLKATPRAGGPMAGDECGTFTLTHTGEKNVTGATLSADQCWNR